MENDIIYLFKKVDVDFDGSLSKEEIVEAFMTGGVNASLEIDAIMNNLDINESGALDFTELKIALIDWDRVIKKKLFPKIFKVKNNSISVRSLKHLFIGVLPHEWNDFSKKANAEEGRVSLENFKSYIKQQISNTPGYSY